METKEKQQKQSNFKVFDKRVIRQIVQEIESGVPRNVIIETYKCSRPSINTWMKKYGSEHYKNCLKKQSFSRLLKQSIITSIMQNRLSIDEAMVQYEIRNKKVIRRWLAGEQPDLTNICTTTTNTMAKKKLPDADPDIEALKKALEESQLKVKALNTMIDIAEKELKVEIRKKSGAKRS